MRYLEQGSGTKVSKPNNVRDAFRPPNWCSNRTPRLTQCDSEVIPEFLRAGGLCKRFHAEIRRL